MIRFRWGVFGTGAISAKFMTGLTSARSAELTFVASRTLAKAQAFAGKTQISRAIGGYAEAAAAGGVDAVYIATPPALHAEHAIMCIEAGLPVLVEKPFGATAADAAKIASAARSNGVFAMEAMWTRFLPATLALRDRIASSDIGDVRAIRASFGSSQIPDPANGMFDPALGGGAVAHLGAYPLSLGQWLFGTPSDLRVLGTVGPTGVDEDASIQLRYPNGVTGAFFVSLRAWAPDEFEVLGSEGMIRVRGTVVRPHGLDVSRDAPRMVETTDFGLRARLRQHGLVHALAQRAGRSGRSKPVRHNHFYTGNGYHYEADEVRACVERGATESAIMPLDDSIAVAATAERIREALRTQTSDGGHLP